MSETHSRTGNVTEVISANKVIVSRFFDALSNDDFDTAARLVDSGGEWWSLAKRGTRPLSETLERIKRRSHQTRHGFSFRIDTLTAEEDRVAARVEGCAEFPDGRVYDNLYHYLFRMTDGRIAYVWEYYDTSLADRILRGPAFMLMKGFESQTHRGASRARGVWRGA